MPIESSRDPRVALVRDKYFSMRPKPLEQWIWQQGLPQTVERVFWFHWDQGAKNGTWCSQIPIRVVARECCVDPSTVSRAYQCLKASGLIRREEPGRDPADPFRQLVAVTEVLAPRDLVQNLSRAPNRQRAASSRRNLEAADSACVAATPTPTTPLAHTRESAGAGHRPRAETRAILAKLSAGERTRMYEASRLKMGHFEFDTTTALSPQERGYVLQTLALMTQPAPPVTDRMARTSSRVSRATGLPRRPLPVLEVVRVQREIRRVIAATAKGGHDTQAVPSLLREVVWSAEEGTLAQFSPAMAVNIALKKIREGAWRTPHRMPPDWQWHRALPELCGTAGV
jgi:DNA-binding MarR family transcriptional regulator